MKLRAALTVALVALAQCAAATPIFWEFDTKGPLPPIIVNNGLTLVGLHNGVLTNLFGQSLDPIDHGIGVGFPEVEIGPDDLLVVILPSYAVGPVSLELESLDSPHESFQVWDAHGHLLGAGDGAGGAIAEITVPLPADGILALRAPTDGFLLHTVEADDPPVTPTPEPATLSLASMGVLLTVWRLSRRPSRMGAPEGRSPRSASTTP